MSLLPVLPVLLGAVIGLVLGLTGAGGSIFAVPLLIWGLGWTLPQAVPVALLAVAAAATFGTIVAWDKTYVRYRAALLMSATSLAFAPLGLEAAHRLPVDVLMAAFAMVLALVSLRLLLQARRAPAETMVLRAAVVGDALQARGPLCRLNPASGRLQWTRPCALALAGTGSLTGFLSGLLGVGGGFVIVPALRSFSELSMHSAVATSLMAIALTSSGTVAIALGRGQVMPWTVALFFVGGALLGMLGGRRLAPRIAGPRLQQAFAGLMLLVAAGMSAQAFGVV